MGRALVTDDGPGNGELIVLLAGDYKGDRLRHAVELVRRGYAPKILVDGPPGFYGFRESDLAMRYAETQGWPAGWLDNFPIDADSTREEARLVAAELRRRGVRRYLLVTSNYHTGRAARVFREAAPDIALRVVAAPDRDFDPERWWQSRRSRRIWLLETTKTVAYWFGL